MKNVKNQLIMFEGENSFSKFFSRAQKFKKLKAISVYDLAPLLLCHILLLFTSSSHSSHTDSLLFHLQAKTVPQALCTYRLFLCLEHSSAREPQACSPISRGLPQSSLISFTLLFFLHSIYHSLHIFMSLFLQTANSLKVRISFVLCCNPIISKTLPDS